MLNKLELILANKIDDADKPTRDYSVDVSSFRYRSCNIRLIGTASKFTVSIEGMEEAALYEISRLIIHLVFIAQGKFATIANVYMNDNDITEEVKSQQFFRLEKTAELFNRKFFVFANIDDSIINRKVLNTLNRLVRSTGVLPLFSLENIMSESYREITIDNKLNLLLQACEGIWNEIYRMDKKQNSNGKYDNIHLIDKFADVFSVLTNHSSRFSEFLKYIPRGFGRTKNRFFKALVDTRDDSTHFYKAIDKFDKNRKKTRKKTGSYMRIDNKRNYIFLVNLYAVSAACRLRVLNHLGIVPDNTAVSEMLYVLRDYMYDFDCELNGKERDVEEYKSDAYNIMNLWK